VTQAAVHRRKNDHGEIMMTAYDGRFRVPEHLAILVGNIAQLYSPSSAIDPCCDDISLLLECRGAKERRAIFRNPSAHNEYVDNAVNIELEIGDITRMEFTSKYDLVVNILPFGARDFVDGRSRRLDLVIAERCLDIMAQDGVCLMVVPAIFLTGFVTHSFRQRVLSELALDAVIELPSRTVEPRTVTPSALLVIRHGCPHMCGTFLGDYGDQSHEQLIAGIKDCVGNFFVSIDKLERRWDRHFHDPIHNELRCELERCEMRPLGDFGDIRTGRFIKPIEGRATGDFVVLTGRHIRETTVSISNGDRFINQTDDEWSEQDVVKPGDVAISLVSPVAYVYKTSDPPAVAGNNIAVLHTPNNEYVSTFLNTPDGKRLFEKQTKLFGSSLAGNVRISLADLREIRIPILPLNDLNSVSDTAIAVAAPQELEELRLELARVNRELEIAVADLERNKLQLNQVDEILKTIQFVKIQNDKVLEQQRLTNAKLDEIAKVMASLCEDIGDIKTSSRTDEEKLARICKKLDAFAETNCNETRTIDEYIEVVQTWLDHWETLDTLTKVFLPSAEQIFDLIKSQTGADFSPFVIQYCRAFENEILVKLFCAYHDDIIIRFTDIASFLATDLGIENTKRFAKCVLDDNRRYTLGDMNFTLQLLKPNGKTLASSPLLQDFRDFVPKYFDQKVAQKEFLDRIKLINEEFRTKAAHPYVLTKQTAVTCSSIIRSALSELLNSYRIEVSPFNAK